MEELKHRIKTEKNGMLLKDASPELRDNADLVIFAIKYNIEALQFASDDLKEDVDFMLNLIKYYERAFEYIPEHFKHIDFLISAINKNPNCVKYIKPYLTDDEDKERLYLFLKSKGIEFVDKKYVLQRLFKAERKLNETIVSLRLFIHDMSNAEDLYAPVVIPFERAELVSRLLYHSDFTTPSIKDVQPKLYKLIRDSKESIEWPELIPLSIGLLESTLHRLQHIDYLHVHPKISLIHRGLIQELSTLVSSHKTIENREQLDDWLLSLLNILQEIQIINDFEWYITHEQLVKLEEPYDSDENSDSFSYTPRNSKVSLTAQINSTRFDRFTSGSTTYSIPSGPSAEEPSTLDVLAQAFHSKSTKRRRYNHLIEKYSNAYEQHIISKADLITIINDDKPFNLTNDSRSELLIALQKDLSHHLITLEQLREIIHKYEGGKKKKITRKYKSGKIKKTHKYKKQRSRKIKLIRK